jgi:hypothetical protein
MLYSRHELKPKLGRRSGHFALTVVGSSRCEVLSTAALGMACNDT